MKGCTPKAEKYNARHNLTPTEEETLVQYILDLDSRGFPPRIDHVRDMADLLRKTRHAKPVGKQWPYNFIQRRLELKTRFSRVYDF
jgi:Tc5 transposase DNA-binding domain